MSKPIFGHTRKGHPVHAHVWDHHPAHTRYQRFNKRVALLIVNNVGTMTCTWLFCVLAVMSLPAILVGAHVLQPSLMHIGGLYIASAGLILLVSWTAQSFIQLVLLPALMVGQNLQNAANDARASKTFEDIEDVKNWLSFDTEGGVNKILTAIEQLQSTHKEDLR